MTLSYGELKRVNELRLRISGAYRAAGDVRQDGAFPLAPDTSIDAAKFREYRAEVGKMGYEHLAAATANELIPAIRELIPNYPNPFKPNEFEPGEEVPYITAD